MTRTQTQTDEAAAAGRDYFAVLGLPRKLALDPGALKRTFHQLSRAHHPDLFHGAPADERERALARSTLINDAYNCLKDRIRRVEHLLALEGRVLDSATDAIPPRFFDLVMEVNMAARAVREGAGGAAREELDRLAVQVDAEAERALGALARAERAWDDAAGGAGEGRGALVDGLHGALKDVLYVRRLQTTVRAARESADGLHG